MQSDPPRNLLAEALTERMEGAGLSARELAEEMDLSHPTVLALSRGTSEVQFLTLRKIARYFEWGPEEVGQAAWSYEPPVSTKHKKRRPKSAP